jgi:hypothetical protein
MESSSWSGPALGNFTRAVGESLLAALRRAVDLAALTPVARNDFAEG